MSKLIELAGGRKNTAFWGYLIACFVFSVYSVKEGADLMGVAAVCVAWATGLGTLMWGNVGAKKAANGAPKT